MKYLKLRTVEELPSFMKDGKQKQSHITIVYFGEAKVNDNFLITTFSKLKPFVIKKIRPDLFGKNKDIPVVVYEITENSIELHDIRLQVLQGSGTMYQNFANWTPHISSVNFDECPNIIHVTGIESDDGSINIDFTE